MARTDRTRPPELGRLAAGVLAHAARSKDPAVRELLELAIEAGADVPADETAIAAADETEPLPWWWR